MSGSLAGESSSSSSSPSLAPSPALLPTFLSSLIRREDKLISTSLLKFDGTSSKDCLSKFQRCNIGRRTRSGPALNPSTRDACFSHSSSKSPKPNAASNISSSSSKTFGNKSTRNFDEGNTIFASVLFPIFWPEWAPIESAKKWMMSPR